ncbi:S-methyl-5-thioribose-1-phosphate isomerase [Oryzibacter oryziterrae]|uniref:S-methyl-5-thioribose-1-phosphate isomerase n=1 Tax=Oryzibacter oryziterrae TaxID=2766474 RepID=UPI001F00CA0B|nr:S-methyl-5-thioribose-1-phosphate isomerase [Oryzibacter oryziterrae]
MKVAGTPYRSIRPDPDSAGVFVIDQRWLPHEFRVVRLGSLDEVALAITDMWIRGAPLIGATAAYGLAIAMASDPSDAALEAAYSRLARTRPTAINLLWALNDLRQRLQPLAPSARRDAAYARAAEIADEDVEINRRIGENGLPLIRKLAEAKGGKRVNILTHCNAGWLATVDWGTATSPIYQAFDAGIDLHVWVDETRPRNQGASLTAWELAGHGVPHTLIADNAGGHLMQQGEVDMVIVGTDRVTANGDVANKIGTYLKALAAADNGVPFHVALPSPTIDWSVERGADIPIEERSGREVSHVWGRTDDGALAAVRISPEATPLGNPAFDVTPARLVTSFITERGVCPASRDGLRSLFG